MNRKFQLSAGAVFMLSALYFFGGIVSLAALLLAAAAHEMGHIAAIKLLGGGIKTMRFEASGMCISICGVNGAAAEITALLAGPAAGFVFAVICSYSGDETANRLLLECAGYGTILTAYNLLPALPLDGGRAVFALLSELLGFEKAKNIIELSGFITGLGLAAAGLAMLEKELGAALLVAGIWLLIAQTGIVKNMRL